MNVQVFSSATTPGAISFRRVLISVFAIVAVLFGLLAMHSMTLTSSVEPTQAHGHLALDQVAVEGGADTGPSNLDAQVVHLPTLVEDCGGGTRCAMLGMACILALLTVALALLLRGPAISNLLGTTALRVVTALSAQVALPRPPSLVALSISRT